MKITQFRTDPKKEQEGVWIDIGDGGRLLIARLGNRKYQARQRELIKPHVRAVRTGSLPIEKQLEILLRNYSENVLMGWEGIQDEAGVDVPYSPEKAYEYLTELRDFRDMVTEFASEQALYRAEELEADSGNSQAS